MWTFCTYVHYNSQRFSVCLKLRVNFGTSITLQQKIKTTYNLTEIILRKFSFTVIKLSKFWWERGRMWAYSIAEIYRYARNVNVMCGLYVQPWSESNPDRTHDITATDTNRNKNDIYFNLIWIHLYEAIKYNITRYCVNII